MQSQKWWSDLCSFPRQTIQYHSNPSLCPNQERWRSWSWTVLWRPTRPFRTNTPKRCPFHYSRLECKSRKSRNTWLLLLLLLLSRFSHVRLSATPQTAAHQAPPSLGFSRQEHWSGLPLPSPMHACVQSCFSHVWLCAKLWTAALQAPPSMGFSRQEYWSGVPLPSPRVI